MTIKSIQEITDASSGITFTGFASVPFGEDVRTVAMRSIKPDNFPCLAAHMARKQALGNTITQTSTKNEKLDDLEKSIGLLIDGSNISGGVLTFAPKVSLQTLRLIGIIGASLTLAYDSTVLVQRGLTLAEIAKHKDDTPDDLRFKKIFLEAVHEYSKNLVLSSSVAVGIDAIEVAASVVPIISLPANLISFTLCIGRLILENHAGKVLEGQLKELISKYEDQNEELISTKDDLKEQQLQLKTQYEQAKAAKVETANALEEATIAMRKLPHKESIQFQQKATQKDVEAEQTIMKIEAQMKKLENTMTNLEVYEHVLKLILEFDPLLKKEISLTNEMAKYEKEHPEVLEKDGVTKLMDKLESNRKSIGHELFAHKLLESDHPLFLYHRCEYTEAQANQINLINAQLKDLNAYKQNKEALDKTKAARKKLEQKKQEKLANSELSPAHFETPKNIARTISPNKVTITTPRPIPTLQSPTFIPLTPVLFTTSPSTPRTTTYNTAVIHTSRPIPTLKPLASDQLTPKQFLTPPTTPRTITPNTITIHSPRPNSHLRSPAPVHLNPKTFATPHPILPSIDPLRITIPSHSFASIQQTSPSLSK